MKGDNINMPYLGQGLYKQIVSHGPARIDIKQVTKRGNK
jgi:hypothetical protein